MEETNVKLLNKLTQQYLNTLHVSENERSGGFVFSGDGILADGSGGTWTYTGEYKSFKINDLEKIIDQFKEYIDKNGVDDKFLKDFSDGYKNVQYPNTVVDDVAQYICDLKRPDYVLKLLDLERCFWRRTSWRDVIIESNNPEYIKHAIEKIKPYKEDEKYWYKRLKKAYKQAVKSNKAGV